MNTKLIIDLRALNDNWS